MAHGKKVPINVYKLVPEFAGTFESMTKAEDFIYKDKADCGNHVKHAIKRGGICNNSQYLVRLQEVDQDAK